MGKLKETIFLYNLQEFIHKIFYDSIHISIGVESKFKLHMYSHLLFFKDYNFKIDAILISLFYNFYIY